MDRPLARDPVVCVWCRADRLCRSVPENVSLHEICRDVYPAHLRVDLFLGALAQTLDSHAAVRDDRTGDGVFLFAALVVVRTHWIHQSLRHFSGSDYRHDRLLRPGHFRQPSNRHRCRRAGRCALRLLVRAPAGGRLRVAHWKCRRLYRSVSGDVGIPADPTTCLRTTRAV